MFQSFDEYMNAKGKIQEKPIVCADADTGPEPKNDKPPKAAKQGKNWKAEAAQVKDSDAKPYKAPGTDPGQKKYEKGLVDKGDQKLVYKPKAEDQELKTSVKTKTEEFLDQTKDLTSEEYAKFILQKQDGLRVKKIIETTDLLKGNNDLMETFIRELKRKDEFSNLINAILEHPETYSELAISLSNETKSKEISRQLAKAINEITAPPEKENDDDDEKLRKAKTVKGTPNKDNNIMMSKKQYVMMKPEHHLIEALASYKNIRATMQKILSPNETGRIN